MLRFLQKRKDLAEEAKNYRLAFEEGNLQAFEQLKSLYIKVRQQKKPPKIWVPIALHTFLLCQNIKKLPEAKIDKQTIDMVAEVDHTHTQIIEHHSELFILFLLENPDMRLLNLYEKHTHLVHDSLQKAIAIHIETAVSIIHQSHIPEVTLILLDYLYDDLINRNNLKIILQKINDLQRAHNFQNFQPIFWESNFNFLQTPISKKLDWDSFIQSKYTIAKHFDKALAGDSEKQYILGNTYHEISHHNPEYTKQALYFLRLASESETKGENTRELLDSLINRHNDLLHQYHLMILDKDVAQLKTWIDSKKEFKNFLRVLREYPGDLKIVLDLLKTDPIHQEKVMSGLQQLNTAKKSKFSFEFFSKKKSPPSTPLTLAQTLGWENVCSRDLKQINTTFADPKNPEQLLPAGQKLERLYRTISQEIKDIESLRYVDQISPSFLTVLMDNIEYTAALILRDSTLSKDDMQLWLKKLEMIYIAVNKYVEKLCDYQNPHAPNNYKKNPR